MNNAINEIKNTLEGNKSRITETEDRISEVEDKMVEINEAERKKEKRIKRNEDNLRDFWDNVKRPTIRMLPLRRLPWQLRRRHSARAPPADQCLRGPSAPVCTCSCLAS